MKIYFVDALAGKGKTTAAIKYALKQAELGAKTAIVQPSKDLIDQTFANLENLNKHGIQVSKYHSGSLTGQVKQQVIEHVNVAAPGVGEILLITHTTFLSLNQWHNTQDWDIIIDEIPQIYTEWNYNLNVNFGTLTDNLDIGEGAEGYGEITVKAGCESVIKRMAENKYGDVQDKIYQDLAVRLHNYDAWENIIHLKTARVVMDGSSKGRESLLTYSLLRPQVFSKYKTVTVMGAMFSKSVMYMLWKNKVQFEEHAQIASGLSEKSHNNGSLLTIKYLYETNWSKTFREQIVDGKTVFSTAKEVIMGLMKQKDFIYATNNDDNGLRAGIRLSNISHGINDYQHINNAVFLSALNSNGPSFGFMKANGISPAELTEAQFFQTIYQFIMRTSLRNAKDKSHKTIIVMDKRSADFLAGYFPGCTVEAVDGMEEPVKEKIGRPVGDKPAMTAAERMRLMRARKKAKQQRSQ